MRFLANSSARGWQRRLLVFGFGDGVTDRRMLQANEKLPK